MMGRRVQRTVDDAMPTPVPQLLVMDLDDPASGGARISGAELRALRAARNAGFLVAAITAYRPDAFPAELDASSLPACVPDSHCPSPQATIPEKSPASPSPAYAAAVQRPEQHAAVPIIVIPSAHGSETSGASDSPVDELARICTKFRIPSHAVTVIASCPQDAPCAFEAGCVCSLKGAGETCEAIADAVFPARNDGGLMHALEHVTARRAISHDGATAALI